MTQISAIKSVRHRKKLTVFGQNKKKGKSNWDSTLGYSETNWEGYKFVIVNDIMCRMWQKTMNITASWKKKKKKRKALRRILHYVRGNSSFAKRCSTILWFPTYAATCPRKIWKLELGNLETPWKCTLSPKLLQHKEIKKEQLLI